MSGFVFLRIIDQNTLKGGWWYDRDLPNSTTIDNHQLKKIPTK